MLYLTIRREFFVEIDRGGRKIENSCAVSGVAKNPKKTITFKRRRDKKFLFRRM